MLSTTKRATLAEKEYFDDKVGVAEELSRTPNCLHAVYDFAVLGGAVGNLTLLDHRGRPATIPDNAVIRNVHIYVETACTSGGAATVDLDSEAANDLLAAEAVASFSGNANLQGIPDFATVGDYKRTTAERSLVMSINTAALTAGKFHVYVDYVLY